MSLVLVTCADCNGSGYAHGDVPCLMCDREGSVWVNEEDVESTDQIKWLYGRERDDES